MKFLVTRSVFRTNFYYLSFPTVALIALKRYMLSGVVAGTVFWSPGQQSIMCPKSLAPMPPTPSMEKQGVILALCKAGGCHLWKPETTGRTLEQVDTPAFFS